MSWASPSSERGEGETEQARLGSLKIPVQRSNPLNTLSCINIPLPYDHRLLRLWGQKSLVTYTLNFAFDGVCLAPWGFACSSELQVRAEVILTPPQRQLNTRSQTRKLAQWSSAQPQAEQFLFKVSLPCRLIRTKPFSAVSSLSAQIPITGLRECVLWTRV